MGEVVSKLDVLMPAGAGYVGATFVLMLSGLSIASLTADWTETLTPLTNLPCY